MAEGLIYLSQPARLGGATAVENRERVIEAVTNRNLTVIHPFEAFPYERFEGAPNVGRERAMAYCCKLIDICEAGLAVTGISEGTLLETEYLLKHWPQRPLLNLIEEFDPDWRQYRDMFVDEDRFGAALQVLAIES